MAGLLIKLFKRKGADDKSVAGREKYGKFSAVTGLICNVFLFFIKLTAGILSSSVSVVADAVNNLSDSGSCLVTLFGFKLSSKPADKEHPFGHGRIEYMSGFIVAVVIILVGVELLKTSIGRISEPEDIEISALTFAALTVSVLVKLWMAFFNRKVGKIIDSAALKAAAADSLSDVISTGAVIISMIVSLVCGINIDAYTGLVVAGVIIFSGIGVAKDTLDPLLGRPPENGFVNRICDEVLSNDIITGVHDVMVHDYGPGRRYVSLHAEVPSNVNINTVHDVIDNCERSLEEKLGITIAVIHMDPIETDNQAVNEMRDKVLSIVKSINDGLSIHDFRMVSGESHTNLIFDVVMCRDMDITPDELKKEICNKVCNEDERLNCIINVDFDYTGR